MVINSTNINKTNNHLSSKITQKRRQHVTLKIHILAWDKHNNVAGLNQLIRSQPSPHDNWVSIVHMRFIGCLLRSLSILYKKQTSVKILTGHRSTFAGCILFNIFEVRSHPTKYMFAGRKKAHSG